MVTWKGFRYGCKLTPHMISWREITLGRENRYLWRPQQRALGPIAPDHPVDGDSVRGGSLQARDVHCPQAAGHCEVLSRLYPIGLLHLNDKVLKGLVRCSPVESEAIPASLGHD